ncbi:MAG: response regulator [Deltaproteobacteria bacterium]|jgi:CheY-like chemotaxis protein|nr:response regulator [Deltaproteobacteria bacterium]
MSSKKILVIDDEPDVLTYLTMLLEDQGYETCSAKDGLEGMEKIRQERPDLVCLDLLMPRKTGVKLYHEMRKDPDLKNIPVVMVTAFGPPLQPGIDFKQFIHQRKLIPPPEGYIEKPIDQEVLIKTIAGIFERQPNPFS